MLGNDPGETVGALLIGGIALVTAGATWLHWRRFMVPITVAAGTAALAANAVALILSLTGVPRDSPTLVMALVLVAGLGVFALAMWGDRSARMGQKIGRAWCRGRGGKSASVTAVAGLSKKKKKKN